MIRREFDKGALSYVRNCIGFIIGRVGVKPDPSNVESIRSYPRPETQTQQRAFLGLLNFYGVASLGDRATSQQRPEEGRGQNDLPVGRMEQPNDTVARRTFSATVLIELPSRPFRVTTDASKVGLGGCLSQLVLYIVP
jgi:hypothetical protein